ncbi:Cupin domain protein [Pelagimonas phthalicica]|uniref:Cupin domain protein n=1 Tax=Pelagimonas phthalicica TaxID=1037362 RepID=A0A238JFR3_9RHOB|nr:dimethylsulfonioproprionate lyase family protein [Pelagimonas phthalicica]TDS91753.1 dimethylsulfoniopropionate lyase DddQ [Pelagimonas phthalicica]SMX28802.1 Cupin domain protein [Pelagimonas phthalicica]
MTQASVWAQAATELEHCFATHPTLAQFSAFPTDLRPQNTMARGLPARDLLTADQALSHGSSSSLRDAVLALAPVAHWLDHYRDSEIGDDFLNRFGCFCLVGDQGGFASDQLRAWLVYMPPHLHYPWHHHPAEELYLVLAGKAEFLRAGQDPQWLTVGDTVFHAPNQPHAMTTGTDPVLCLVFWRDQFETGPQLTAQEA